MGKLSQIRQLKVDICFVGTNAIEVSSGLMDNDWEVVQIKKAMIESSAKVVSLTISEKLNTTQRIKVCDIKDIDVLITELEPGATALEPYQKTGITIL